MNLPAIAGGKPVREALLPYGHQCVDDADIQAVGDVLRGDWLTTGPAVQAFEQAVAAYVGAKEAVAVNSGTAALHTAAFTAGIGPGDEVIVPPMTFAASANCVLYLGGKPVFADVLPGTLNLDPADAERKLTPRTKAIDLTRADGKCGIDIVLPGRCHGMAGGGQCLGSLPPRIRAIYAHGHPCLRRSATRSGHAGMPIASKASSAAPITGDSAGSTSWPAGTWRRMAASSGSR